MTTDEYLKLNGLREGVRRLVPEIREYLSGLCTYEAPMPLDNWACMLGAPCDRFMRALCFVDKELFHAYQGRRRQVRKARQAAIAATTCLEDRKRVAKEFEVSLEYVHKWAQQLKNFIRTPIKWDSLVKQSLECLTEAGGSMLVGELAQALGVKKARIYTDQGRVALEKVCDFTLVKVGRSYQSRISIKPENKHARDNRKRSR